MWSPIGSGTGVSRRWGASCAVVPGLRAGWPDGFAGIAMGWAEVALGAHYPTDALGGFCTALAVVPGTAWLVDRVADRL